MIILYIIMGKVNVYFEGFWRDFRGILYKLAGTARVHNIHSAALAERQRLPGAFASWQLQEESGIL
jgi:hypothetical protein